MKDEETTSVDMPRLFNVFDIPDIKSVRAVSSLRQEVDLENIWGQIDRARKIRTAGQDVVKYEVGEGNYLLLFSSGYVQIYAPSEDRVREVLKSFRDELYGNGLLK